MAVPEDAASILDEFVHDVSNLPAEIQHLLEEVQAKDAVIQESRRIIDQRDAALQQHVKKAGGHVIHPKEAQFKKQVEAAYDKAQALQEEKVALSHRACLLVSHIHHHPQHPHLTHPSPR